MLFRRNRKRVCVALSGGVDSAVAAYLLKKKGYEVFCGFIRGYNVDGCQSRDAEDAARVAAHLSLPFYSFDFEKEYEERVVKYLLDGYKKGITPNPDVVCNSQIKFGLFYDHVMKFGADAVASGHYAVIKNGLLYEGADNTKDQSYFLWDVPLERFSKILFPVGGMLKRNVRRSAQKAHLPNADKKDSQGVCFLGKFDFEDFLRQHLGAREGNVCDIAGRVIGTHHGAHLYTIGQRHGFVNLTQKPLYVIAKDISANTLIAVHKEHDELKTDQFIATQVRFLDARFEKSLQAGTHVRAWGRCRYHQPLFACTLHIKGSYLHVSLKKRAAVFPAPGQSFVAYASNGKVLAGSVIAGYEA